MRSSGEKLWRQASNVVGSTLGNSKSYSKIDLAGVNGVDQQQQQQQRVHVIAQSSPSGERRSRKGCIAISACILLVIVAVIAVVVGVKVGHKNDNSGADGAAGVSSSTVSISSVCNSTL
jgi:Flp pilus assembly protein TadB